MRILLLALSLLALPITAESRPIPEVQRFLQEEIVKLAKVEQPDVGPSNGYANFSDYQLSLFRLRLLAEFGFDVGLARVTVVPSAEFFWE